MNKDDSRALMSPLVEESRIQGGLPAVASRPEPGSSSRWRARAGVRRVLGLAGALVVLTGATTLLLSRGPKHVSGWNGVPVPVSAVAKAAAASECLRLTNQVADITRRVGPSGPAAGGLVATPDVIGAVAVAERRGDITGILLTGATTEAVCLLNAQGVLTGQSSALQALGVRENITLHDRGTLSSVDCLHPANQSGLSQSPCVEKVRNSISMVDGQVASTVSRVSIRTTDGRSVEASIGGGFFMASWPSSFRAARVTASGADGTVLALCLPDRQTSFTYRCQKP